MNLQKLTKKQLIEKLNEKNQLERSWEIQYRKRIKSLEEEVSTLEKRIESQVLIAQNSKHEANVQAGIRRSAVNAIDAYTALIDPEDYDCSEYKKLQFLKNILM